MQDCWLLYTPETTEKFLYIAAEPSGVKNQVQYYVLALEGTKPNPGGTAQAQSRRQTRLTDALVCLARVKW